MSFKTHKKDHGAAAIRKVANELKNKNQPHVAIGVLNGQSSDGKINLPTLAAIHEFGTEDGHIPARSFLRSTFREQKTAMTALTKELYRAVIFKKMDTKEALSIIGEKFVAEIKKKIQGGIPPPNAESTVKAKGSSTPLIDTGRLVNAVTYKVNEHGGGEE